MTHQLRKDDDSFAMQDEEDSDVDLEVLDEAPYIFRTSSKKKTIKCREQLMTTSSDAVGGCLAKPKDIRMLRAPKLQKVKQKVLMSKRPRSPRASTRRARNQPMMKWSPFH
jgi:hypothetical protein